MKKLIYLWLFSCVLAVTANAQNNDAKMQVMMKMMALRNALLSKDSVALDKLMVDDVSYGHSTALIQNKAELIRAVKDGEQDYKSIEPSDMNVRVYDNTAIVTMKFKASLTNMGKPVDLNLSVQLTWVKLNGDWKLVSRQGVKLPD